MKCGVLNCPPTGDSACAVSEKRVECSYTDLSTIFNKQSKDFSKQFAHIYAVRLSSMSDMLKQRVLNMWGSDVKVCKLVELPEMEGRKCVIIGTLFCDQRLKPSILKDISEEAQLVPQPTRTNFVSDTDTLILEDELQRIVLLGSLDVHQVVTGVVCAVLGCEDSDTGKFVVEDHCFTGADYIPCSIPPPASDQYLVLLSGLDLANNANLLQTQLMVEWLSGFLGEPQDQVKASKVVRVILAGNSIRSNEEKKEDKIPKTMHVENSSNTLTAVKLLDDFLHQLVQYIDVDIMPGEYDPSNRTLPQKPLHYCMFPQASRYKSLHGVTNPYSCLVNGRRVTGTAGQPIVDIARYSQLTDQLEMLECTLLLCGVAGVQASRYESLHGVTNPYSCLVNGRRVTGTAGQPIVDIARYSQLTDQLEILERTLTWGHLSPTSPDTLPCYPFSEQDPFIMEGRPDIYFAGNMEQFQTKLVEPPYDKDSHKVRLVCVPQFATSPSCVLVNLSNLDCHTMSFGIDS